MIAPDDDGWVSFSRGGDLATISSRELLKIRNGFSFEDILAAVAATGWVVQRDGEWWIEDQISCQRLVYVVERMFSYFESPGGAGSELVNIKRHVDLHLREARGVDSLEIPLWAYAWLDLVLREAVAEEAGSADQLWKRANITVNVEQLNTRLINELGNRYLKSAAVVEPRLAGSARKRASAVGRNAS